MFSRVPKDLIRWWVREYVAPADYPSLLLTSRLFHVLSDEERAHKYLALLRHRERSRVFHTRVRMRHAYDVARRWRPGMSWQIASQHITGPYETLSDAEIDALFVPCPHCSAVVKRKNLQRHLGQPGRKAKCDGRHTIAHHHLTDQKIMCKRDFCTFFARHYWMWAHSCDDDQIFQCVGCGESKPRRDFVAENHETFDCWEHHQFPLPLHCSGCGLRRRQVATRVQWLEHRAQCKGVDL